MNDHTSFDVPSGCPDIVTLATSLWGEPKSRKDGEVRFGQNGSKSVQPAPLNLWHDHESNVGGGYLDLYKLKHGEMPPKPETKPKAKIVAVYDYPDEAGGLLFQVCRMDPKSFRQRRPDATAPGGWTWDVKGVRPVPYRLPGIVEAPAGTTVFVAEGEKDCDNLARLGLVATCNAGGAMKWRPELSQHLAGRHVVILPDNDMAGGFHAQDVAGKVFDVAASVRIVALPDLPAKGDASDWLAAGGTVEALAAMVEATGPWAAPSPGAKASANRPRPDLHVDDAEMPAVASELAKYLAHRPMLFDRGGPVRLTLDVQGGGMKSSPLTVDGVTNEAHEVCRPFRWVRTPNGPERKYITLPVRVATLYLDRRDRLGLRPLDGIACAPLLHDNGTIRTAEGYDTETRLWCERVPSVTAPDAPTEADAKAALRYLRMAFRTFCFADASRITDPAYPVPVVDVTKPPGVDESAFLTGLMTAVCRPSLPLAPGLVVRAPQFSGAGTGKGLLVRAICAVAFGAHPRAMTGGHDPAELDKRIVAALIGADFAMFLDNLNATSLKSDVLASVITERPAVVRPLGRSEILVLNSAAFVAITGNALTVSEDMARRFLTVDLDAGTESPEARPFVGDFLGGIQANRGCLLRAALTIWRWGRLKGKSLPVGKAMGSFPQWARWCRDPLLALGCADPADRIATTKAQDPRRAALGELFTTWWAHHKAAGIAINALHDDVRALADPANRGRQYLAARVRNLAGTRVAGFALSHHPMDGAWVADRYSLSRTETETAAPAGMPDDDEGAL